MTVDQRMNKAIRDYFNRPGFLRFLRQLQNRYQSSSSGGRGYVTLQKITDDERRVLDEFYETYSPPNPNETKRYSIKVFERLLKNSRFSLTLPELFHELNGEQAWTRLEQKSIIDAEWEKMIHETIEVIDIQLLTKAGTEVVVWAEGLRNESSSGSRTLRKLFSTSRDDAAICLKYGLRALLTVTEGCLALPIRLPILAAKITGDAHALDWKYPLGRLFWWGLTSINKEEVDGNQMLNREPALSEIEVAALEDSTQPQSLSQAIILREGYRKGGIADDDISSQAMIFAPALFGVWEERLLTLRQVERLNNEQISHVNFAHIYVVENPSVFAELVDAALLLQKHKDVFPPPVFICGNGQPTVAVIKLLDLLCRMRTESVMHYAGDLDIKGLSIAQGLQMRYPHAFQDWRMNTEQYLQHVIEGIPLSEWEKNKLRYTEYTWDRGLGNVMADKGFKLHQELWVEELICDWLQNP